MSQLLLPILAAEPAAWLVCLLGIAVVFAGLIAIVGIVVLMNFICNRLFKPSTGAVTAPAAPQAPLAVAKEESIPNRQEILAAVCAAVAEENGTDISAIRVISFKKL